MEPDQPELFGQTVTETEKDTLRTHLHTWGWQTRCEISNRLGWSERKIRDVAEAMGADIVRGQAGFKLTLEIERETADFARAIQAADAAHSQGRKMLAYSLALRRRLHALIAP